MMAWNVTYSSGIAGSQVIQPNAGQLAMTGIAPSIKGIYATNFPLTENPISESGAWINGKTTGLLWNDVQTGSGNAYGTVINNPAVAFDDSIAILSGFGANQSITGTVFRAAAYNPANNHEINLFLRGAITANNIRGYEINLEINGAYAYIVRWNGASGSFAQLAALTASNCNDGDVLYAQMSGTVISVKKNGTSIGSYDTVGDTTKWSDGSPGIDFWAEGTAVLANAGLTSVTAGNL